MALSPQDREDMLRRLREGQPVQMDREGIRVPKDTREAGGQQQDRSDAVRVPVHKWGLTHWHQTLRGQERVQTELALVDDLFPSFRLDLTSDGRLCWVGTLTPSDEDEHFEVAATCHNGHLSGTAPTVEVLSPALASGCPHRFTNGALCYEHGDFTSNTPITDVLSWVRQWITLYQDWRRTGRRW